MKKVLLPFAREVGTPEVLRKLLALTAADIAAVGPDVLTKWKESSWLNCICGRCGKCPASGRQPMSRSGWRIADEVAGQSQGITIPRPTKPGSVRNSNSFRYGMPTVRAPGALPLTLAPSAVCRMAGGGRNGIQCSVGHLRICRDCA